MPTTQIRTPELDIVKIDVVEGFNSREEFDKQSLAQLAETIKASGVVQPILVSPTKNGRADLVAGERRFRAAKLAGLKKVPVTVSSGSARAAAFFENSHRADLNAIEKARDIKAFAEEFNLGTNKKIAAKAQKKPEWVGEHLRLLELPEAVQRYFAAGDVPLTAEPKLRRIADVSPEVAAHICEVAKRRGITGGAFVTRFADIFSDAGDADIEGMPTMIRTSRFDLSEVITDPETQAQLAQRINALAPSYRQSDDPTIHLSDPEIDAARAAGCLVEHHFDRNAYISSKGYLTDKAFAADLVHRFVDRLESEEVARVKAEEATKVERKAEQKKLREERKASGEESVQAKAKKRKEIARTFNDNLKRALVKKRTVGRRKKYALSRAQAVACQLIADNPKLAGRGLRLVSDHLQDLEVKSLKSGDQRQKVTYADIEQSTVELERRVKNASDPLEVIEILSEALLAAIVADSDEVPNNAWVGWHSPVQKRLEKILAGEIKEVRPRRSRKPY